MNNSADLRAPDPLRYIAAKISNIAASTSFLAEIWTRWIEANSARLVQTTRASIGLVQVDEVDEAKSNIIHMRAHARIYLYFFCTSLLFLTLKFEFVRKCLVHLVQTNVFGHSRLVQSPRSTSSTSSTISYQGGHDGFQQI